MSDEPLSRRARRERAETGEFATGAMPSQSDESLTTEQIQAERLSRRDRRRLERVNQPVETWTAEEEMIATGQIPTVTPEVIAQLEREAQEKAARLQAEAEIASAELRRVSPRDVAPERVAEVTGQWPEAPQPQQPPQAQPQEPTWQAPEPAPFEAAPAPAPPPEPASAPAPEPEPAADPQMPPPEVIRNLFPPGSLQARAFEAQQAQQAADAAAAAAAGSGSPQPTSPSGAQAEDDAAAEIRRLTAAAMAAIEGNPASERTDAAPSQAPAPGTPGGGVAGAPAGGNDNAPAAWSAEAAAAKSGQVRRTLPDDADWEATVKGAYITPVFPDEDTANRNPDTGMPPLHPLEQQPESAQPYGGQAPASGGFAVPGLAEPEPGPQPPRTGGIPRVDPVPPGVAGEFAALADQHAPATSEPAPGSVTASGEMPVPSLDDVLGMSPSGGAQNPFPPVAPQTEQPGVEAAWESHPLNQAPVANVDVNAFEPATDVTQPDFSALPQTSGNPFGPVSTGSIPQVGTASQPGGIPMVPGGPVLSGGPMTGGTPLVPGAPMSTGSIPVVRREPPLQPVGGARHFRWTHYALLGALMFVLGVVVYNVIRLNS